MRARLIALVSTIGVVAAAVTALPVAPASAAPLSRPADPVVLTGADLPTLSGDARTTIVGFRWTGTAWAQLPIQIDERAVVNFGKVYNDPAAVFYNSQPALVNALVYTATNTWTGRDPNGKFDDDDELVFMARDAGSQAPGGSQPTGTVAGSGVEVHVTDPMSAGSEGFVYLFHRAKGFSLPQAAKTRYVTYGFRLLSGSYKSTYNRVDGPNPENSLVKGATYRYHFSDRWLSDSLQVTAPGASGVDILERHKALFAPGVCVRSEDTFNDAEGAYVINKNGPVRGIRSYVGANSGPSTQRTHFFYDRRQDIRTDLRVHAIPSVMDFMDYSSAAIGMTYRNELNPTGVTIDGSPDTVATGFSNWEQVTGAQGTVTHVGTISTTGFTPTVSSYYLDDSTPPVTQCTGDSQAIGASGQYITSSIPNLDPALGPAGTLAATRVMYFDGPGGTATDAADYSAGVLAPLETATAAWTP